MRQISPLITGIAILTLLLTFPTQNSHAQFGWKKKINRSISKNELIDKASQPKDKIWVVDIWASWCVPCVAAIPELKNMYEHYENLGVEFISVSYDVKKKDWIKSIRQHDIPWPQVMNGNPPFEQDEFKWMFPHSSIPSFYIISKDGTIDQMRDLRDLKYSLKALTITD